MTSVVKTLHLYVAPFLMGMCMAAVASGVEYGPAWLLAAIFCGFASLPAGRRAMQRMTGAAA